MERAVDLMFAGVSDSVAGERGELERVLMRTDELQGLIGALCREADQSALTVRSAAQQVEELRAVFALIEVVAAHVARVETAVASLETQLNDSTKEFNKIALRSSLSPVSKLFGIAAASTNEMSPFRRPDAVRIVKTDDLVEAAKADKEQREEKKV